MSLQESFARSAAKADEILRRHAQTLNCPFIHRYPFGCCELVSLHVALVLAPIFDVRVAKAYNRTVNEWHYWVEVEGLVLDLTAHQFEPHSSPVVCKIPTPLEQRFPDVERLLPNELLVESNISRNDKLLELLQIFDG